MRTNIVIDDELMEQALKASGARTKKEAVDLGLKALVRLRQQADIRKYRGKLSWSGDLAKLRTGRPGQRDPLRRKLPRVAPARYHRAQNHRLHHCDLVYRERLCVVVPGPGFPALR